MTTASASSTSTSPPVHYVVALFPCLQLLDVAGPLDVLNVLSTLPDVKANNMTLAFVASTLDPVPTKPIPPKSGAWTFDPGSTKDLNTTFNQYFIPDSTFDDYLQAATDGTLKNPIDVLIIPGGIGTRIDRIYPPSSSDSSTQSPTQISNTADLCSFIQAISPHIRHSIMTVCTGSYALASTGLLNDRRATTNMTRWEYVTSRTPDVKWLKARRWVKSVPEEDGDTGDATEAAHTFDKPIYTSAGISAGIDVTLAFVAEYYDKGGVELARRIARALEYEWRQVEEGEVDPLYHDWNI